MPPRPERLVPVIPAPHVTRSGIGTWNAPDTLEVWVADTANAELKALGSLAVEIAASATGKPVSLTSGRRIREGAIQLRQIQTLVAEKEGTYTLTVAREGVAISSSTGAGLFYGLQSLRQLLESIAIPRPPSGIRLPAVTIVDTPRFTWRGLHLDIARHFQPVSFVKKYIDLMSRYKLNTFHWHLTDDQGWRIDIRKYPRLTSVGGCRKETMVERNFTPYVGDNTPHCGFYTQDEIRDVVEYARQRYITVVPEIEMPGHAKAALAAYPELACTPGPFEVRTTWGVDDDVFCPHEATFTFLEDVLTEVIDLFPSRYIHVGGDEVPKTRWKASPMAQEIIQRENLKDEAGLQSWFIRRMERFLTAKGRRLIGWDEILEGGLAPDATVMSWRGTSGGIAAAREGHDVIMSPNSPMYFDHYQGDARSEPLAIGGFSPLEHVYSFEPVPDSLTTDQARHILGAQANLWTEYLKTPEAVEYMVWPRALALAELTWSSKEARDWNSFVARLPAALRTLDRLGVNYRVPHVEGLEGDRLTLASSVDVSLRSLLPGAEIRYTTDGSEPIATSPKYERPFRLSVSPQGTRVTARAFLPNGRSSPPRTSTFTQTTHRPADQLVVVQEGLRYQYMERSVRSVRAIDSLPQTREAMVKRVERKGDETAERYALRFSGYLRVPADGLYEFALTSDDGSNLEIGERVVVNNDGLHGDEQRTGMIALRKGLHPMMVRYFQGGGGASLSLKYRVDEREAWLPVPDSWYVMAALTRHDHELEGTFSVIARDPASGELGMAVQSKTLAVGSRTITIRGGLAVIAHQSSSNPMYGALGMELLTTGMSPQQALDMMIRGDDGRDSRQVAILDATGRTAAWTGSGASDWKGHRCGTNYCAQGNILVGQEVVESLARVFESSTGSLAERLLAAMDAGQSAGGDSRGTQSAALVVAKPLAGAAGFGDRVVDLRVDDSRAPLTELRRLLNMFQAQSLVSEAYARLRERSLDAASTAALAARTKSPEFDAVWVAWAATELAAGRTTSALEGVRKAIELNPANARQLPRNRNFETLWPHPEFVTLTRR
jgi:hexosaminidase